MQHTLVAVFDNRSDAQNALDELLASGFSRTDVNLSTVDPSGQTGSLSDTSTVVDGTHEEGIGASIKHFFNGLFGSDNDEHAMKYSSVVTSGRHVVTVTTQSEPEVERAADVIERFGPVDIDERHDLTAEQAMAGAGATGMSSGASSGASSGMYAGAAGSGMAMGQSMQSASMGSGTLNTAPGALQNSASEDRNYFATQNINDPVPKDTTFQEPLGANMQSGGSLDSAIGGNTLSGTQTSSNNPAVSTQQGLSGSSQNGGLTSGGTTVQGTASLPGSDDASLGGTIQSGNLSGGTSQNYQRDTNLSGTTLGGSTGGSTGGSLQRDTSTAIPVVQEELKVGKREVQRGGVRVFSRIIETPVDESVSLREEHVNVERRPVDQPLSTTDSAAFKEQSIELREMAEEAIVQKSARVVEEVRVGKEVSNREEHIHDTVRHTDVRIESLGSDDDTFFRSDWDKNYSSLGGSYDDYAPAYRYGSESRGKYAGRNWDDVETDLRSDWDTKYAGSGVASTWEKFKAAVRHGWDKITPDMDDSDTHYRDHWNSTYGTSGDTYNDYEPAYKYGTDMRSNDKYRGRDWNDVESDLHSDWDTRYGKGGVSTWDKMKAAVRHGWDRVTS